MRIRFNIGTGKNAIMVWGKGRTCKQDVDVIFTLGQLNMPQVNVYKDLGILISARCSWSHHAKHMATKAITKSREIDAWARIHQVQLDLALTVWTLYVLRAVLYGASVCWLSASDTKTLDRAQRQCGRLLLGFSRQAPGPAVLALLGWTQWSVAIQGERFSLLRRITGSTVKLTTLAIHNANILPDSWYTHAMSTARRWFVNVQPQQRSEWAAAKSAWSKASLNKQIATIINQCNHHPYICSFTQCSWAASRQWVLNPFLHNTDVAAEDSRSILRLLVAGQDLRGGDPMREMVVTQFNCCVFCLMAGRKQAETLHHVSFHCPAYNHLRVKASIKLHLRQADINIFKIHRRSWSWRQVKDLRSFFLSVMQTRTARSGGGSRTARRMLQATADDLW